MSKTYEMISESLNEIIQDLEENDGKNLKRETISIEKTKHAKVFEKKSYGQKSLEVNFADAALA